MASVARHRFGSVGWESKAPSSLCSAGALQNVEIVFKDGVGYESEKLIQSVQGLVGIR